MQSTSNLCYLPRIQNARRGQKTIWEQFCLEEPPFELSAKLPTGYGKTLSYLGAYYILKKRNLVNRLLVIVPTSAQLDQLVKDAHKDLSDLNVDGPLSFIDVGLFKHEAISLAFRNEAQAFCTTIQGLSKDGGFLTCREIMSKGRWLVVVDECHHYAVEKAWGETLNNLNYDYLLAMSATPYRDKAFFKTQKVKVTYREAVEEKAVKPLKGHSYTYRIDLLNEDNEPLSFTTKELIEHVGTIDPQKIEKQITKDKMRWSPKYVSELVERPILRMIAETEEHKEILQGKSLQAIVGCLCVSHAKIVCKQIQDLFPELRVNWVGTGEDGRKPQDNKKIIDMFCPQKDTNGNRNPELDVLVHVGMAGEGLDSVYVSEVIHLNPAGLNNSNLQENGRAARYIPGIVGHINFDSTSDFAKQDKNGNNYTGDAIMDAMDNLPAEPKKRETNEENNDDNDDIPRLKDKRFLMIRSIELIEIDSGELEKMKASGEFDQWIKYGKIRNLPYDYDAIERGDEAACLQAAKDYNNVRHAQAMQHNKTYLLESAQKDLNRVVSMVTGIAIRKIYGKQRKDKSLVGDIKKRINQRKKYELGEVRPCEKVYQQHYDWMVALEREIFDTGVPEWLL